MEDHIVFKIPTKENYNNYILELQAMNSDGNIKLNFIHSLLDCVDNKYRDPEAHRYNYNFFPLNIIILGIESITNTGNWNWLGKYLTFSTRRHFLKE